jgi:hypothetical protein
MKASLGADEESDEEPPLRSPDHTILISPLDNLE